MWSILIFHFMTKMVIGRTMQLVVALMRETRTNQKDSKMHYTMEDKLVALLNN